MTISAYRLFLGCLLTLLFSVPLVQAAALKSDNEHTRKWNKFANDVLALHKQLIQQVQVTKHTRVGGYSDDPDYYQEEKYTIKETGKILSKVQWEKDNPEVMHAIEVYVYDDQDRIHREYMVAYLPGYRNAPNQTLLHKYQYNGELQAFRTYEATGDRIGEQCKGKLNNKEVFIVLDEDEIAQAEGGESDIMKQPEYQACFKGMPVKADEYLTPQ